MPQLATAVTEIRSDLNRSTDFNDRIRQALQHAVEFYRARRYGFNTKRKTFTVTSEYTSLTANFIEVDSLRLYKSNSIYPLDEITYTRMNCRARDVSFSSQPEEFALHNRQLRLYPAPDQTYSVEMFYLYDLQNGVTSISLSASDSTSSAWLEEGWLLIKSHAMVEVLEEYIDGPDAQAKADRFRIREVQAENELKRRANREQSSGRIRGVL